MIGGGAKLFSRSFDCKESDCTACMTDDIDTGNKHIDTRIGGGIG